MLNLKKEANNLEIGELKVANCPVCKSYVSHQYFMQDAETKKKSKWFSCSCGIVFNAEPPKAIYDQKYWDKYGIHDDKIKAVFDYPVKVYSPIIEELMYGRRVLLVGRQTDHQEEAFAARGWVPTIIDKNTRYQTAGNLIAEDFETFDFKDQPKFSLIWMQDILQCFVDPLAALTKCKELLAEDGIIYIASPDSDFINTRSSSCFKHWKADYNHILWNRRSITRQLDQLGFNVILSRQNYEYRFPEQDDFHVLAQVKFF